MSTETRVQGRNPFDPARTGTRTRRAFASLWSLAPGKYVRGEVAAAMARAAGIRERWADDALRWAGSRQQLPQIYRTIGGRRRAVILLSRDWLDVAFPGFDRTGITTVDLDVEPIELEPVE